eukprot:1193968-Prorocentrum_minimum.AAC.1
MYRDVPRTSVDPGGTPLASTSVPVVVRSRGFTFRRARNVHAPGAATALRLAADPRGSHKEGLGRTDQEGDACHRPGPLPSWRAAASEAREQGSSRVHALGCQSHAEEKGVGVGRLFRQPVDVRAGGRRSRCQPVSLAGAPAGSVCPDVIACT